MQTLNSDISFSTFKLAGRFHIIATRFLDILIAGIIVLPLALTENSWGGNKLWATAVLIAVTFVVLILYFLVIPLFWKSQTLAKMMCGIRLVAKEPPIKFRTMLYRECIIIFIPWLIQLISDLIISLVLKVPFNHLLSNDPGNKTAYLLFRITSVVVLVWYLYLIVAICFDPEHQFVLDRHFMLFIVKRRPLKKQNLGDVPKPMGRDQSHIHLQNDQPGNISDEELKAIEDE